MKELVKTMGAPAEIEQLVTRVRSLEARAAEAERRAADLEAILASTPDIVTRCDRDLRVLYISPAIHTIWGRPPQSMTGRRLDELELPPEVREACEGAARRTFERGEPVELDVPGRGVLEGRLFHVRVLPERSPDGEVRTALSITRDVTAERASLEALRASEARYRSLFEGSRDAVFIATADGRFVDVNAAWIELLGWTREEAPGLRPASIVAHGHAELCAAMAESGSVRDHPLRLRRKNGQTLDALVSIWAKPKREGSEERLLGVIRDVTAQRRAEEALKRRTWELAERAKEARCLYAISKAVHAARAVDPALQTVVNLAPSGWQFDDIAVARLTLGERVWTSPGFQETPWRLAASVGQEPDEGCLEVFYLEARGPFLPEERMLLDTIARHVEEILRRDAAEQTLQRSEAWFRALIEHATDLVCVLDPDGRLRYVSPTVERLLDYMPEALMGTSVLDLVHPEDLERVAYELRDTASAGEHRPLLVRVRRRDGAWRWLEALGRHAPDTESVRGVVVNARDVTERVEAEQARRDLEGQLRQAMKMEAIGRLAGGVAHDFNNLLTVIKSGMTLLLDGLHADDPRREDATEVLQAADRAAALTRQLLAFSKRQVVRAEHLPPSRVVQEIDKLLRRLVGEDVEIKTRAEARGSVSVDAGRLEQVIVNLVVNARDAMPRGGRLLIETRDVEWTDGAPGRPRHVAPGRWVELAVTDNGVGMSADVLEHIFEPFFTTKEGGTGLGLATVYGIVLQAGGTVWAESEPGRGTTMRVLLPRVEADVADGLRGALAEAGPRGTETILLVEDEPRVRGLARRILERCGYTVLEAGGGSEALEIAGESRRPIDLLLCDVVMPRMSGPELVKQLAGVRPGLPVLFMSGYTDNALARHGLPEGSVPLLEKPFGPDALSRSVREMLDGAVPFLNHPGRVPPPEGSSLRPR